MPLLTSKEAAQYLNVSEGWLALRRSRVGAGKDSPPYLRLGSFRCIRYDTADLDQWLQTRRTYGHDSQ